MTTFRVLTAAALVSACSAGTPDASRPKIIGGHESGPHPFMAGLIDEGGQQAYCGASFIAKDVVLTAAHCVVGATARMRVSAGLHDNSDHADAKTIGVKAVRVHPAYGDIEEGNDLALLFLEEYDAAALPAAIEPIALNGDDTLPTAAPTVIGWGNTTSYGELFVDGLREVQIPLVGFEACKEAYPKVGAAQICAGDFDKGGVDSCQGDSGGPLVTSGAGGGLVLAGIVSFGQGCALAKRPGVYTRVSSFKNWIEGEIKRFQAPHQTFQGDELTDYMLSHCYARLTGERTETEGLNDIRYKAMFGVEGAWTNGTAAAPATKKCDFALAGGDKLEVHLAGAGAAQTFTVKRTATGAAWTAKAAMDESAELYCAGNASDASLNFSFAGLQGTGFIHVKGEYYDIKGVASELPPDVKVLRACKVKDFALRFLQKDAAFFAEVTTAAGAKRFALEHWAGNAGGAQEKLQLVFAPSAPKAGAVSLENPNADDVFTWNLICDRKLKLTDAVGKTFEAIATDHAWSILVETTASPAGTVRGQGKVAFKYESSKIIGGQQAPTCQINGLNVKVVVH